MKCAYGICTHCETDVMSTCKECGTHRPNGKYTEVMMNLSNGSKMPVAVCLDCKDKVFQADRKELMAAVRQGWHREHDKNNWTKEQREAYWSKHGEGILEIVD